MTSICSGLVVQIVSALLRGNWQDFNRHDASRGPSAIAKLLVTTAPRYSCGLVSVSVTSRCSIETCGQIELVFGMGASFDLSSHTLLVGKFWCFQKGYFPLDLFPKFWIKKISQRQVARVVNKTRQRSSSLTTFASADASCLCTHIVYYTPFGVMLLLHYFDFYWICYTTCSTSCAGVSKISTDTARRAVRPAVAELLVSLAVTKIRFTIRG